MTESNNYLVSLLYNKTIQDITIEAKKNIYVFFNNIMNFVYLNIHNSYVHLIFKSCMCCYAFNSFITSTEFMHFL